MKKRTPKRRVQRKPRHKVIRSPTTPTMDGIERSVFTPWTETLERAYAQTGNSSVLVSTDTGGCGTDLSGTPTAPAMPALCPNCLQNYQFVLSEQIRLGQELDIVKSALARIEDNLRMVIRRGK